VSVATGRPAVNGSVAGKTAGKTMGKTAGAVLARSWLIPVVVVGWELATRGEQRPFFPSPQAIWTAMRRQWVAGEATGDLLPSVGRLLAGWAAAAALGIVLGVALGRSARLARFVEPIVHFGRAIPPPTLVPLFLVLFKVGTALQLATIIFGVIWPVLLNSIDGARYVDRQYLDTGKVFGVSSYQRLVRIVLPAAAPKIFAGLRLSLPLALIMMVISEFVGSTNGIGRQLYIAQQDFAIPAMWSIVVLLGILGFTLNAALLVVERHVLAWHHAQQTVQQAARHGAQGPVVPRRARHRTNWPASATRAQSPSGRSPSGRTRAPGRVGSRRPPA
jgi:ABC-type nitrate/sulfonate/bicarbonate transport system permease component